MKENVRINTKELKQVVNSILTKKGNVDTIYNDNIKKILLNSRACITESGLSYDQLENKFNKLMQDFDKSVSDLIDVLQYKIIPGYEDLTEGLRSTFNNNFKNQMEELLEFKEEE